MESYFSAEFFSNNRKRLRKQLGHSHPIVVAANGVIQRSADEAFPFRQDNNFWYLTGIDTPDLLLVIGSKETYLIAPTLTFEREAFDGAHDVMAFTMRSGIRDIYDEKTGWEKLKADLHKSRAVSTLDSPPELMKRHGIYTSPVRRRLLAKLRRIIPKLVIEDIRPQLADMRCMKQPEELLALQKAIDITTQTIAEVRRPAFLQSIGFEYELEAAISFEFRRGGNEGHAFPPVVASGKNATTLHHMDNNDALTPGGLTVLDIGAAVEHYSADISRTISATPPTKRQQEVVDAVTLVQDFAISQIKPGVDPFAYEASVEKCMGEQLIKLGVITEATRENIRHYFPHATSHYLGLDTHDVGDYHKPYQAGMVITCEPGIYIPEEGIGVRIEDDLLITETGCTVLSAACSRGAFYVQ